MKNFKSFCHRTAPVSKRASLRALIACLAFEIFFSDSTVCARVRKGIELRRNAVKVNKRFHQKQFKGSKNKNNINKWKAAWAETGGNEKVIT